MLTPTLDAAEVRNVIKHLRSIDDEAVKRLRAELKSGLSPIVSQIVEAVPENPPLRGFSTAGATGWAKVRGATGFTPGKNRQNAKNLVAIRITPAGDKRGLFIAELAGSRSAGSTPQGANLIAYLNRRAPMKGRGGRYAYAKFRLLRPDIVNIAARILNKTFAQIESRIS